MAAKKVKHSLERDIRHATEESRKRGQNRFSGTVKESRYPGSAIDKRVTDAAREMERRARGK